MKKTSIYTIIFSLVVNINLSFSAPYNSKPILKGAINHTITRSYSMDLCYFNLNMIIAVRHNINDTTKTNSLPLRKDDFTPLQRLMGDTLGLINERTDTNHIHPGEITQNYTQEQDSAYFKALRLKIPAGSRFNMELKMLSFGEYQVPAQALSPNAIANSILNIPQEFYLPSGSEVTMHMENIERSLSVPFVNTHISGGMQVPISLIKQLLGLEEDLSPAIIYNLEFTSDVEVVVYSVRASVIRTIFKGIQPPGNYRYIWNGRDDMGKLLPKGDYIAEIRIGKIKYIRKRILMQ